MAMKKKAWKKKQLLLYPTSQRGKNFLDRVRVPEGMVKHIYRQANHRKPISCGKSGSVGIREIGCE